MYMYIILWNSIILWDIVTATSVLWTNVHQSGLVSIRNGLYLWEWFCIICFYHYYHVRPVWRLILQFKKSWISCSATIRRRLEIFKVGIICGIIYLSLTFIFTHHMLGNCNLNCWWMRTMNWINMCIQKSTWPI